jgi:beta-mannanase
MHTVTRMKLQRMWSAAALAAAVAAGAILTATWSSSTVFATRARTPDALSYDKMPVAKPQGLQLGAYDPFGDFNWSAAVTIEHIFIPWQDVDLTSLTSADDYALARGRALQVTVEPWSWSKARPSGDQLREAVLARRYGDVIASVCAAIGRLKSPTTIRWAHEMDDHRCVFPWSRWPPADYVAGFRDFVDTCRHYAPSAKFMWSPIGEPDMNLYYPGDPWVDVVGAI